MSQKWQTPTVDDVGDDETLIEVAGKPDSLGRVKFFAYWRDDYLPPDSVRGQVFYAVLEEFIARSEQRGHTVRFRDDTSSPTTEQEAKQ